MIISSLLYLLLSNAVTLIRDKYILFKVAILVLLYSSFLAYVYFYIDILNKDIALYGGLFHATSITQVFYLFIFLITVLIIQLFAFYPTNALIP